MAVIARLKFWGGSKEFSQRKPWCIRHFPRSVRRAAWTKQATPNFATGLSMANVLWPARSPWSTSLSLSSLTCNGVGEQVYSCQEHLFCYIVCGYYRQETVC